ncbi:MAG: class I SAM-dependent methyltransferase [Stellaceae bacterium]
MKASAKATGFDSPTRLPRDQDERRRWQSANRAWWERTPMRYDWREKLTPTPGSIDYFEEIDRRFLTSARGFMPERTRPFDAVIPFDALADRDVLEIGVGQGTHAQLLAPRCKSYAGIDMTTAATAMTSRRLHLFRLPGAVLRMDAEALAFCDESFDYVWSWGVVHHTADTARALAEIRRVLRPGGECTLMVYYRSWWSYYLFGLLRWLFLRRDGEKNSVHAAIQDGTDGTIARFYTPADWRTLAGELFAIGNFAVYGQKSDVVPLPAGWLKDRLIAVLPDPLARFLTGTMRMGSFLVIQMQKAA